MKNLLAGFRQQLYLLFHPVHHIRLLAEEYRALTPRGQRWVRRVMAIASVFTTVALFCLPPTHHPNGDVDLLSLGLRFYFSFITGVIIAFVGGLAVRNEGQGMMKWFGTYTGYALQQELEAIPTPVGVPCARCGEPFVEGDTGMLVPGLPDREYPFHWNCHLRSVFGSVAHIEERCSCFVEGATCTDPEGLTPRQAADAAVAAYFKKHPRGGNT